jgi:hypothetical protein
MEISSTLNPPPTAFTTAAFTVCPSSRYDPGSPSRLPSPGGGVEVIR